MIIDGIIGGATAAGSLIWAIVTGRKEGLRLLNPFTGWLQKMDLALSLGTLFITLTSGPLHGMICSFMSAFSSGAFHLMNRRGAK